MDKDESVMVMLARSFDDTSSDPELLELLETYESASERGATNDASPPLDVRVARPLIRNVAELYTLAGMPMPAGRTAREFIVVHRVTPFHQPGKSPGGVWGLGYEAEIIGPAATTLAVAPRTEFLTIGQVTQKIDVLLGIDGTLDLGKPPGPNPPVPAGVPSVRFHAATTQSASLSLELVIKLLRVQAGSIGNGGCKWNLYRQAERLDGEQVLLQTLKTDARTATMRIATWASRSRLPFWRRTWEYEPIEFDVAFP